jgi:hypothetical protein
MENSFSSIVESANSILILLPTKPYFDQVAAGLSLYLSLKKQKEVNISCPAEMIVEFNRLIAIDKISTELGNKNLTIKFPDYNASDIERVSYDIENGEFKLTVIPKPGFLSPKKEQLEIYNSGISADTVILIGGGNISHFPLITSKDCSNSKLIHIGTRGIEHDGLMSFSRPSSSVSEIVTSLIEEGNFYIDPDIATNLIAGIEEASKDFKSPEVTADTFQKIANLMKSGGNRISSEKDERRGNYPLGSIPQKPYKNEVSLEEKQVQEKKTPPDWLAPKIYKGNTVS